jgi:hypothetical protein
MGSKGDHIKSTANDTTNWVEDAIESFCDDSKIALEAALSSHHNKVGN